MTSVSTLTSQVWFEAATQTMRPGKESASSQELAITHGLQPIRCLVVTNLQAWSSYAFSPWLVLQSGHDGLRLSLLGTNIPR